MRIRDLTIPLYEAIRLDEMAPVYTYMFTSDPNTEELVEIPIFQIRNAEEMKQAIAASGGPEARGFVSDRMVIGWDSHRLVHDEILEYLEELESEDPENAPPPEEWEASVYFYADGVAIAPNSRTYMPINQQVVYVRYHPILVRIYGSQPVPIVQPRDIR